MNILVTAGATREPIDDVRYLSNISSGATGTRLAEALAGAGHTVTLLRGLGSLPAAVGAGGRIEQEEFSSAADLQDRLRRRLAAGDCDAVIMAAAVSDYRVAQQFTGKLSSRPAELTLTLTRNEKILPQLKGFSPRPLVVVGFKLTSGADPDARRAAVRAQFAAGGVDLVVHNDLAEFRQAGRERHPFHLYADGRDDHSEDTAGVAELARQLDAQLANRTARHAR